MKHLRWQIILASILIFLSIVLYFVHYTIFRDAHHIFLYLLGDIAFVPIEVLLVTVIIHQVLSAREKSARMEKLNMVIGAFFSEVGTKLLTYFSDWDPKLDNIRKELMVTSDWTQEEFLRMSKRLKKYDYGIDIQRVDLAGLRTFLGAKLDFLVRLLENPTLLEHESFTNLLWAVFHLAEELAARGSFTQLPQTDYQHLAGDIKRIYVLLVHQWLNYMEHLKDNFPYLFSLAMRTNPFDQEASPVLQ
ncbi:MAG: hypothetical protein A2Z08_03435 [Deltaproteobacteria bacterium RBG_16_54_11]|nr:MAG: hypothetical protein A2Z08_03435 [Deltaproteobacteria bacterium RBG_16_54_11]